MQTYLGLYIEKNLIKYAKVSKERETTKIDAFGVSFFDNLGEAIGRIINETNSAKIPISINLSSEMYNYFEAFSMLKESDIKSAIQTEFEIFCEENGVNKNNTESRYYLTKDADNSEKVKIIHIWTNKDELKRIVHYFDGYKLNSISALPMDLEELIKINPKENIAIVNMEDTTTITTIVNGEINNVDIVDYGAKQILENITEKENSYVRAYEICKNTTIYTLEGMQSGSNEYLDVIMPTLYNVANNVKQVLDENKTRIEKIYLTGTLAVINNIDLYFQEFFTNSTCEVLKPYFLPRSKSAVNIKEYMEVNSALALALRGINGKKDLNFRVANVSEGFKNSKGHKQFGSKGKKNLLDQFDKVEKWLFRVCASLILFIIMYSSFSIAVTNSIKGKYNEAENRRIEVQDEIDKAEEDIERINKIAQNYSKLKQSLVDSNQKTTERYMTKNSIPNLLNKIMFAIPSGVQILSIENTSDRHIVIKAGAEEYESLGLFIGVLKQSEILTNVMSDSGIKQDSLAKVTIEGDLP